MRNFFNNNAAAMICGLLLAIAANGQTVSLQLQADYPVGTAIDTPRFGVGDFNNDGRPDLVTLNPTNLSSIGPLSIFLNNGAGGYGAPLNTPGVTLSPTDVVVRDFNGDGMADLGLSQTGISNGINIRLGNGTGNFLTGTSVAAERGSPSIASADFNGDNIQDVAICNNVNELRVLNGNGSGGFGAAAPFTTAAVCQDLVTADFNVDGRPDLAVAMRLAPTDRGVQVFLNNGTSFNAPLNIAGAVASEELITADLNRDCIPDIVAAQFASSVLNTPIFILIGNGAGGFTSTTINVNNFPRRMTIGDFNLDKKVDLVLRRNINNNPTANTLTILPGNGSGGFGAPFEAAIANATTSTEMHVATTDANRDGKDDLVIGRQGGFQLHHGNSARFTATDNDYDGDLKADLSVFRPSLGEWYTQRSTQGFLRTRWGNSSDRTTPADYDGDGKADIAVWRENGYGDPNQSNFYILRSTDSTFQFEQFGRIGDSPVSGDWDGDGKADVAVYRNGATAGAQSFFFYRPSGTAGVNFLTVYWGINGDQPARGDFDGDGRIDAAVFRPSNGVWYVRQSSNGQLAVQNWGIAGDRVVPSDYDGDGRTDFAVFRPSNNFWYVRNSSNGAGVFSQWGTSGDTLVPADYNGDGRTEVATYRPSEQRWYVPPCALNPQMNTKFGTTGDVAAHAAP